MTTFTESNTFEQMIIDAVAQKRVLREVSPGWGDALGAELRPERWDYLPAAQLLQPSGDLMVEAWVREALDRLNPEIAAQPDRADEVIYNLQACILSVEAEGKSITNIEGLAVDGKLHPLQQAFIDCHALQCGYCTPGVLMAAKAFLDRNPHPSPEEVREAVGGHICRCGTYHNIVEAILVAAGD